MKERSSTASKVVTCVFVVLCIFWMIPIFEVLINSFKKKAFISFALATQTEYLLLDEPTQGLKGEYREKIFNLLQLLSKETTIILVSHYEEEWPPCMTHLLRMPKFSM